jgi:prepilin-type N-terminal cleavage/methylation domain-containing protein
MSSNSIRIRQTQGFTLIEVIVAILLAALLGTLLVMNSGSSLSASAEAVVDTRKNLGAVKQMEQITKEYRKWLEDHPADSLSDFENQINNDFPDVRTDFVSIRGDDEANSILQITVTREDWTLVSLYTK